ncbi:ATP-binding protein [Gandjariella thermophila]|uniref:LuxR family transcriptional regulator n=1 Tax=Gandjariella thermophila TaxID=1931992 RepID=A0A4D4J8M1_9PSEU|nr:LuxR C-terminal-related transcriptional regulator [Gandjariella thermophila]GDY31874.1 LuxR family transcriptional regulator [Gandjariella thermophila]
MGTHPVEVKSFVGRRHEMAEAKRLLASGSAVTLTGQGGVGKTRLALRLAGDVEHSFPDGVWPVHLAAVLDGEEVAHQVAEALGLYPDVHRPAPAALREHLAGRRLLLLLDSCEHVVDACATLVATLLRAAPGLRVVATSRTPIGFAGERVLAVPPLSVPTGTVRLPAYVARRFDAVALFAERAAGVAPTFALTDGNSREVIRLCQRLHGVPLAIELAALRLRSEPLAALLERFRSDRAAEPPDAADWSVAVCPPRERELWARLSVFTGGFDQEDVHQVCCGSDLPRAEVAQLMPALVDRSILLVEERGSRPRYRMPETVRHAGRDLLTRSGRDAELRRRHRDWYRRLVEQADREWFDHRQLEWYQRLTRELPNIRSAMDFCVTEPGEAEAGLAIAAGLWHHWLISGALSEGRRRLDRALALVRAPSPVRARALWVDAHLAIMQADLPAARHLLAQCRLLARQIGDATAATRAMQFAGMAALYQGDLPRAVELLRGALARHRAARDADGIWLTLFHLAVAAYDLDEPDRSSVIDGRAASYGEECLAISESRGAEWARSYGLLLVGLERLRSGDTAQAAMLVRAALRLKRSFPDRWGMALCLETLGWVAAAEARHAQAARLLGAAATLWRSLRTSVPRLGHIARSHTRWAFETRHALGEVAFSAAWHEGAALDVADAVSEALDEGTYHPVRHREPTPPGRSALTRRERQVAALVAQGLGNREIAERLVIAQRTAESHVENILSKLGFTRRTQIADWVARGIGLTRPVAGRPGAHGPAPKPTAWPRVRKIAWRRRAARASLAA